MHLFDFNKLVKWCVGGDEHESLGSVDISINSVSLTLMLNNSTCKWGQWFFIETARHSRLKDSISRQKRDITLKSPQLASLLRYWMNAESSFENSYMHTTREECGLKVRTHTISQTKIQFCLFFLNRVKGHSTTLKKKHFNDMLWLLFMYGRTNTQAISKSVTFSKPSKKQYIPLYTDIKSKRHQKYIIKLNVIKSIGVHPGKVCNSLPSKLITVLWSYKWLKCMNLRTMPFSTS